MAVVKIEGEPILCKTDEVGELCVSSGYTGGYYWGLKGFSTNVFRVHLLALLPFSNTLGDLIHIYAILGVYPTGLIKVYTG